MPHAPQDPEVKAAYRAMIDETLNQYQAIKDTGLQIEFIPDGAPDPYAASPRLAIKDVHDNNHLWVFPTDSGFGTDETVDVSDNPLLELTDEEVNGHRMRANDVFRIVHDYFGHIAEGVGFRANGEENAWRSHSRMYSPLARRAMTSETRGQNSWLNFGPHGKANQTAVTKDTVFAPQKSGLMPAWVAEEGADDHSGGSQTVRTGSGNGVSNGPFGFTQPGHFYRGMTEDEYKATVGAGKGVQSRQDWSMPNEGTSFAADAETAEDYANYGRTNPNKTGKPTYLVEVKSQTPKKDTDDYFKAKELVPMKDVTRVWQMTANERGDIVAKLMDPAPKPVFKTGEPVTFEFIRNTEKAPNMGETFGQHIEPAGRYLNERDAVVTDVPTGWETGSVSFQAPLVLPWGDGGYKDATNWKRVLAKQYGGKRGEALSKAITADGYDGIVTLNGDGSTAEIVDLTGGKRPRGPKRKK